MVLGQIVRTTPHGRAAGLAIPLLGDGADGVDDTTAAYLLRTVALAQEEGGGGGGEGASGKGAAAPGDAAASCRCYGGGAFVTREEEEEEEEEVAEVFLSHLFRRSRFSHLDILLRCLCVVYSGHMFMLQSWRFLKLFSLFPSGGGL